MNPDTNRFEPLHEPDKDPKNYNKSQEAERRLKQMTTLLRPNGEPVPEHWIQFRVGENVVVKNYTFKVVYIGESILLLEPVGPVILPINKEGG